MKKDITTLSKEEIKTFCSENGIRPFVSSQVYSWIWNKGSTSFYDMTNISLKDRSLFDSEFIINFIDKELEEVSSDKTIKIKFKLQDGNYIEGVLIPKNKRMTACISSQVGCSLSCSFCATGTLGLTRNLTVSEIYHQVLHLSNRCIEEYNQPLTNIVFMGMGEPLLNYKNVLKAIYFITSEEGLNMSYKRITLSTSGISKMIRKLADDGVKVNLALSLHAASEDLRNKIMPIGKSNTLEEIRDSLKYYFSKTKKKVTYEYVLLRDVNDKIEDAINLYKYTKHLSSKVNIIEYNPVEGLEFEKSSLEKTKKFIDFLYSKGVNVSLRRSRGKDINAACGQLANKK